MTPRIRSAGWECYFYLDLIHGVGLPEQWVVSTDGGAQAAGLLAQGLIPAFGGQRFFQSTASTQPSIRVLIPMGAGTGLPVLGERGRRQGPELRLH